jgi:Rap1a immunity proteins
MKLAHCPYQKWGSLMRRFTIMLYSLIFFGFAAQGYADQNVGSAGYMLPLCRTWLKIAIEKDRETVRDILSTEPVRLTTAGMCAGEVVGISEALRVFELSCPPDGVTSEQLVRMVVSEIEKHPERLHEDFIVPAAAVFVGSWPCRK